MAFTIRQIVSLTAIVTGFLAQSQAQCPTTISPSQGIQPSVASGYAAAVIATGLTDPRSLEFDSVGNLLVLEAGKGVSSHVLNDGDGTCLSIRASKDLIKDKRVGSIYRISLSALTFPS